MISTKKPKLGSLVRVVGSTTTWIRSRVGMLGVIIEVWEAPGHLGGDTYYSVLVDGHPIDMLFGEFIVVEEGQDDAKTATD